MAPLQIRELGAETWPDSVRIVEKHNGVRRPYSGSFLWAGTESMFAEAGFHALGALGTSKLVMRKVVRRRRARGLKKP